MPGSSMGGSPTRRSTGWHSSRPTRNGSIRRWCFCSSAKRRISLSSGRSTLVGVMRNAWTTVSTKSSLRSKSPKPMPPCCALQVPVRAQVGGSQIVQESGGRSVLSQFLFVSLDVFAPILPALPSLGFAFLATLFPGVQCGREFGVVPMAESPQNLVPSQYAGPHVAGSLRPSTRQPVALLGGPQPCSGRTQRPPSYFPLLWQPRRDTIQRSPGGSKARNRRESISCASCAGSG